MDRPPQDPNHDGTETRADPRNRGLARTFRQAWTDSQDDASAYQELLPMRLARACADVLSVDGAGISFFYSDFRVPVGASDDVATAAERLQFTQGEGPCLESAATHRMLVAEAPELEQRWPTFTRELFRLTPFRAVVSLPLALTRQSFAALDLFLIDVMTMRRLTLTDVYSVSEEMADALAGAIGQALGTDGPPQAVSSAGPASHDDLMPSWLSAGPARGRTHVWVAMGMAMTRFDLTAADAIALLRSYAYGHEQHLDDVASALVEGRMSLMDVQP